MCASSAAAGIEVILKQYLSLWPSWVSDDGMGWGQRTPDVNQQKDKQKHKQKHTHKPMQRRDAMAALMTVMSQRIAPLCWLSSEFKQPTLKGASVECGKRRGGCMLRTLCERR